MFVPTEHLAQLKAFFELCISNSAILHQPDLAFVRTFIEHFGGKIPAANAGDTGTTAPESNPMGSKSQPEPESEESDLELDMTGVIEPDTDAPQKMGNPTLQPTEEEIAESQAKRSEAVAAFMEKDYVKAIELYTEAIVLNPQASLLYAKRGQVFLTMSKPNACIRDCVQALELNPDSAAAHKFRGRAYHLLGMWEEAVGDLRLACKFDFDEQADEWLRETTHNARKIEEHKRKKERKIQDKLEGEKQEKLRKAKEAAKNAEDNTRPSQTDSTSGPGMGDFCEFLSDPEVLQAFQDPELSEAFKEISINPTNIMKYQNNPKVMAFICKMAPKFSGSNLPMGGFSGMMGGMPGFPDAGATPPPNTPKPEMPDDVNLD